jgi:4-amino-4-deoxy-L-arabinose transferase-like glycosyltransferase
MVRVTFSDITKHPAVRLAGTWSWLMFWIACASVAIFQHGPMPMYSTRTLSVAWEMWMRHSYLVPYLNGVPYSDKPPLLLWLIHAGWAVGGVGDVWPRVLEVMLGALQLVLASKLARRLFPAYPPVATAAPWILLAFTYGFLFGLQIMYEVLLADCVLAALLCLAPDTQRESPRFGWLALAIGLGLLAKGPVMLLHVSFPWLLGPYWNAWARRERRRWYTQGALALLAGCCVLIAWALLAAWSGGETYRQNLLFHQTAGRVVDSFAHAQPFWWYLPLLPALIFPFALWPRLWVALATLRRPLAPGLRCLLAWLGPVLLGFSLVSGKQAYYLLPEYGGFAILMAAALAHLQERRIGDSPWLGPWPLALLCAATGVALLTLNLVVQPGRLADSVLATVQPHALPFGVLFVALSVVLLRAGKDALYRIAIAGLIATVGANGLFTLSLWPAYDFTPVARILAKAEAGGRPVANLESNDGQYTFLGRLKQPVTQLRGMDALKAWSAAHPDGLVITYPRRLSSEDREHAVYIQPFRGISVAVWPAPAFVEARERGMIDD